MPEKTVIFKVTDDKPAHLPIDLDQRAVLVIYHDPTKTIIKTRGWSLRQVLFRLNWRQSDILATFRRTWTRDRGAVLMTAATGEPDGFDILKSGKEEE